MHGPPVENNEGTWMSDGEEEDHHFEYYFDATRGLDFKFVAGSKTQESEDQRRHLVQKGSARMRDTFKYTDIDDLYDPDADDDDDKWVWDKVFKGPEEKQEQQPKSATGNPSKKKKARSSAALLSCPCCFTTVCVDCVKADEVSNQWCAIDAQNCVINQAKLYYYEEPKQCSSRGKPGRRGQRRAGGHPPGGRAGGRSGGRDWACGAYQSASDEDSDEASDDDVVEAGHLHSSNPLHEVPAGQEGAYPPEELYRTVHCDGCGVQVAVCDLNGIFHFFSVIPSNA
mmetsp:Transcript_60864/g.100691  ORF Transcript_60864/g.100691 Transcript_60864/m.100691 type:complete len:284 (-) Transcript_60864:525-1376(-)